MQEGKRKDKPEASSTLEQRKRSKAKVSSDSVIYKDMQLMGVLLQMFTFSEQEFFLCSNMTHWTLTSH